MITVLRLDHRSARDKRITTHVCLTSRAFGADKVILNGDHDKHVMESVQKISNNWGGDFQIEYNESYKEVVREHKKQGYEIIHLTMYGKPVQETIHPIKDNNKNKLIIVGGAKVPPFIYEQADWNVSVTTQPHSEVAALAITLDLLYDRKELEKTFDGGKMKIIPNNDHKEVIKK